MTADSVSNFPAITSGQSGTTFTMVGLNLTRFPEKIEQVAVETFHNLTQIPQRWQQLCVVSTFLQMS